MSQNRKQSRKIGADRSSVEVAGTIACLARKAAERAISQASERSESGQADEVCLEIDIPNELYCRLPSAPFQELVECLVGGMLRRLQVDQDGQQTLAMPREISISAWQTGHSIELEVASNQGDLEEMPPSLPMIAAALGVPLCWQNCPQGGVAVTAVLPQSEMRREAA